MFDSERMGNASEKLGSPPGGANPHTETVEVRHEGALGKIVETVCSSPGAIILVSGLGGNEYEESRSALRDWGVKFIDESNAFGEMQSAITQEPEQTIVVNRPHLLKEFFYDSWGGMDGEWLTRLSERSGDSKGELLEWLKHTEEQAKGDVSVSPEAPFKSLFERLRGASGSRELQIVLPAHSALALALATFVKERVLTPESVERTRAEYAEAGDPLVMIKIENGTVVVAVGGTTIGSRPLD